jgi:hypothetical protein
MHNPAAATGSASTYRSLTDPQPDTSLFQDIPASAQFETASATKRTGSTLGNIATAVVGAAAESAASFDKTETAPEAFVNEVRNMTPRQLRRKYAELVIHQFIRTFGSVGIFLVLALFTPPLSTCLLPPCEVPSVVSVVPLLVSFAVSAFVAVQQQFVHRFVLFWDYLLHPDDREPARWSMLIIGASVHSAHVLPGQQNGPVHSPV